MVQKNSKNKGSQMGPRHGFAVLITVIEEGSVDLEGVREWKSAPGQDEYPGHDQEERGK